MQALYGEPHYPGVAGVPGRVAALVAECCPQVVQPFGLLRGEIVRGLGRLLGLGVELEP